jgi:hypothetical protein
MAREAEACNHRGKVPPGNKPVWSAPAHPDLLTPLTGEAGQTARRSANPPPQGGTYGRESLW